MHEGFVRSCDKGTWYFLLFLALPTVIFNNSFPGTQVPDCTQAATSLCLPSTCWLYLLASHVLNAMSAKDGGNGPEAKPEQCLMFEDSIVGLEAARRAGQRIV